MAQSRIRAVEHVELESPPGLEEQHRWFYGELAQLDEITPADAGRYGLCFKSARIELRIRFTPDPEIDEVRRRATLLVPSLSEAIEQLEERSFEYVRISGIVWSDRRVQTLDPAGNRIEFKQGWPFGPI